MNEELKHYGLLFSYDAYKHVASEVPWVLERYNLSIGWSAFPIICWQARGVSVVLSEFWPNKKEICCRASPCMAIFAS